MGASADSQTLSVYLPTGGESGPQHEPLRSGVVGTQTLYIYPSVLGVQCTNLLEIGSVHCILQSDQIGLG